MWMRLYVVLLGGILFVTAIYLLAAGVWEPQFQQEMAETHIYAYRDWQSTGVRLLAGDEVTIRAEGRWLYTPDEYHGPEGHPRFPAPAFYPVSGTAGGVLIGRIGPSGVPFVVGRRTRTYAADSGMLYLRINDDRLTDNDGHITAEITVIPYEVE